jgi:hypothetical protein
VPGCCLVDLLLSLALPLPITLSPLPYVVVPDRRLQSTESKGGRVKEIHRTHPRVWPV